MSCSGLGEPVAGRPAPRKVIVDTGVAVDLIGACDSHNKDQQRKTSEPIHFCTANGTTKADTIVQYYSSALGEEVSPHVLTDSVSALSIGKRVASGCEFHWTLKENNKAGSRKLIKPDGKRIEFEVDEHAVPYVFDGASNYCRPCSNDNYNKENKMPTATPAGQQVPDPDTGQGGPWPVEDDRARRDQKLRSILRDSRPVRAPRGTIASDEPPEPIAYDYSEV